MTDADGDGIYTVAVNIEGFAMGQTVEYKYGINGFSDQENLVNDMVDGASCAPVTDFNAYANRLAPAGGIANDYYGTCDGTCNEEEPTAVTFRVDMSGYDGSHNPANVTWNSGANGWCGDCAPMEAEGEGIYALTVPLTGDTIEYKFAIGNWADQEDLESGLACTKTIYGDAGIGIWVNRFVVLGGEDAIDMPVVCWNSCETCGGADLHLGCTNEAACNYLMDANTDDGSCLVIGEACDDMDAMTLNDTVSDACVCEGEPLAQLPDGSIAPDFTATDINGVEHNLYSYLDSGYSVILCFDATWNLPGWSYFEQGTLQSIHETYGLYGTNEVRVFFLEADDMTTNDDLEGTGASTQGDWVTGTPFPIIDNAGNIFNDYQNTYYPTILTVCSNRLVTEAGQVDVATHVNIFQDALCMPAMLANDALLIDYVGQTAACGDNPAALSIRMMNNGVDPLTSATIEVSKLLPFNVTEVIGSVDWQGALETYEYTTVDVLDVVLDGSTTYVFDIVSPDDNEVNNSTSGFVRASEEVTNNLRITLKTDGAPEQLGWELLSEDGTVVASVLPGTESLDATTEYSWPVTLPSLGCYRLNLLDTGGDGLLNLATSMDEVGFLEVNSMDGDVVVDQDLFYQELDPFSEVSFDFQAVDFNANGDIQSSQDLLYHENFDTYNNGDAITAVSQAFELWPGGDATDAFVTNETQFSGANSLKIEGQLTGGPMDVVLKAGIEGAYDISFNLLVPFGSSGYYNFQENIISGVEWAFECHLNSDSTISYVVDAASGGAAEFTTTYNYGNWVEIKHVIDTHADVMDVLIDGVWVGELPMTATKLAASIFTRQAMV